MSLRMMSSATIKKCVLPISVVLVVGMMLFPLPHFLLDIFLASNLAFSVVLLLSSLFVSAPDKFTSLPSVLLLSTLFRLGLNISSTRSILSGGDIPQMIISFGQFVVSGSTIVGLVVFLIISIVQFIVISKGTERVAEVAARFTLDALPGKQMAIDADMRAGLLSLTDAREKRRELHRESKLYGALDGAMKFVKGDAIVGLCIIFVNITAGFLLAVLRDGMSISKALDTYTLLTIGDALVSQIPAVLVSISAGIVVTRVSEKDDGSLSEDIGSQITKEPVSLLVTSVVLFFFSLLPGLPFLPLLFCAGVSAFLCKKRFTDIHKGEVAQNGILSFKPRVLPSFMLMLSARAAERLQQEGKILHYYDALRSTTFEERGVLIPDLSFDIDPKELSYSAEIYVLGRKCKTIAFAELSEEAIPDPLSRAVGIALKEVIDEHAPDFITNQHIRCLLDMYDAHIGELMRSVMPHSLSLSTLTTLCKDLIEDGISIRDFSGICAHIAQYIDGQQIQGSLQKNEKKYLDELVCSVRNFLLQHAAGSFWSKYKGNIFVLDAEIESQLFMYAQSVLPVKPEDAALLKKYVSHAIEASCGEKLLLLVSCHIRRIIRKLLSTEKKNITIFAFEDLPESLPIQLKILGGVEFREAA